MLFEKTIYFQDRNLFHPMGFSLCYFGFIFLNVFFFFSILGKTITPKVVNEIKLISSGKVLDNNKTVGQCRTPFGEVAGGVIIMHVVVQPSLAKTKTGIFYYKSSALHKNLFLWFLNCYIWNDTIEHLIWILKEAVISTREISCFC